MDKSEAKRLLEDAQAELSALTTEYQRRIAIRKELESRREENERGLNELRGVWGGGGKIAMAQERVKELTATIADCDATKVVWSKFEASRDDDGSDWVVSRRTAKTIYVRRAWRQHECLYNLDGTPRRYSHNRIDVAATFRDSEAKESSDAQPDLSGLDGISD